MTVRDAVDGLAGTGPEVTLPASGPLIREEN